MRTTREMIRDFNLAFDRPVRETFTELTVTERELLGKLLLEEAVEYATKGLGLDVKIDIEAGAPKNEHYFRVEHRKGCKLDPVECVDGLADVNVVAHFAAHWHGFNLDVATEIINDSNMSKLGLDGKPIINGVTPGFRDTPKYPMEGQHREPGFDPSKPIGKILKGPNYWEPTDALRSLIFEGNNQ